MSAVAAGDPIYASDVNTRLGTTTRTSDTSTVTTVETVSDSVVVTLVAGKKYRVRWVVGYTSDTAADTVFLRLREDSVSGTVICLARGDVRVTNGAGSRWVEYPEAEYVATASGSKTFVGTYVRASGSGNVKVTATSALPTYLYVELINGA